MFRLEDMMFAGWDDGSVFDYDEWQARDLEKMLEQESKAKTLEEVLTLPIRWAPWSIKPGDDDHGEAEFVENFLRKPCNAGGMSTSMELIISQATSAQIFRKAFFEKVFKVDNEHNVVYDKLAWRPPTTCGIIRDPKTGAFQGFQQRPVRLGLHGNTDPIKIKPQYAFVHINGRHRDPIRGISDLQIAYWCYVTKQKLRYLWYTFCETQATPRTIVTGNSSNVEENAKKVAKLKNGGVAGVGEDTTVNTLESNGQGSATFEAAIRYLDQEMSNSVLAGFTDLASAASNGRGSLALSKDQSDFFLQSRQAKARELAADITDYMIADLVVYNFGPEASFPRFEFGALSETDMEPIVTLVTSLASDKVSPDFLTELAVKVATYLDLDVKKVKSSMEKEGRERAERAKAMQELKPVANVAGQVDKAAEMVKAAQPKSQIEAKG